MAGCEVSYGELGGRYKVTMHPRWLWWWLWNVKIFYEEEIEFEGEYAGTNTFGLNVAFGIIAWGKRLRVTHTDNVVTTLNYDEAWWPWSGIRDYLFCKFGSDDEYVGIFCYIFPFLGERQLAWFTLEKI